MSRPPLLLRIVISIQAETRRIILWNAIINQQKTLYFPSSARLWGVDGLNLGWCFFLRSHSSLRFSYSR